MRYIVVGPKPYAVFAVLAAFLCLTPTLTQAQTSKVNITFNGDIVTDKTQTIMTGQPVNLAVSGGPFLSVFWEFSFIAAAGFDASEQAGHVLLVKPADLKKENLKLYWIDQGIKSVTVQYTRMDGKVLERGGASTTFDVQGPTNVKVYFDGKTTCIPGDHMKPIEIGKLQFFIDEHGQEEVGLGLGNGQSVGIHFHACATMPSGGSGQFIWVQKVIKDDRFLSDTNKGLNYTLKSTGGHDLCTPKGCGTTNTTYQYDTGPITADSPSQPLGSGNGINQMSRYFEANMYLMWQADAPNSIPVPLGIVNWNTYWYLTFVPSRATPVGTSPAGWAISRGYVQPHSFVPSTMFPEWDGPNKDVP